MNISPAEAQQKDQLRRQMKLVLHKQSSTIPASTALILSDILLRRSKSQILFYASLDDELPTQALWERLSVHRRVYFPRCDGEKLIFHRIRTWPELQKGPWSLEPSSNAELWNGRSEESTVILPGLAFSPEGQRLGRGKGFYDRFLSDKPALERIALGWTFQVLSSIPSDPHDQRIDEILTPQGLWICPSRML